MIQVLVNPVQVRMVSELSLSHPVFSVLDGEGRQVARFAIEQSWPMLRFMLKVGDEVASIYLEAGDLDKAKPTVDALLANYNMVLET